MVKFAIIGMIGGILLVLAIMAFILVAVDGCPHRIMTLIVGIAFLVGGFTGINSSIKGKENMAVEYEVVRIVHYQAYNAEEFNQVWLKEDGGDYFFILVNDKTFFELREVKEDGGTVMKLSEADFEKIIRSK